MSTKKSETPFLMQIAQAELALKQRSSGDAVAFNATKAKLPKPKSFKLRPPQIPVLALRADEAAIALGISRSMLGEWTKSGIVPSIRLGGVLLYPVQGLKLWLRQKQSETIQKPTDDTT